MWGILITVAIFIAGVIGTCCFQWGKYTSDVQNIELKRQLKAKDDTINGLHHPPVNIEQPVDMHTNKRTAKQSHSTTITNPTFNSPSQIGDGNTQNIK